MLITGIKSKPVYAPLQADTRGRYHLMLGMGVGAAPLLRVIAEMQTTAAQAFDNTRVLFIPEAANGSTTAGQDASTSRTATTGVSAVAGPDAAPEIERFRAASVGEVQSFATAPALLERFRAILAQSLMGTRLYVAGPESFIGLAMKIALEFNLNKDEIRAEECGTLARRVYCIHCRSTTENVRTNIVRCIDCERWLVVRDHYSRRLAAYMGVMADAEAPGELPPVKEMFL
jgi:dimethylamine monooxygenase subunit C